MSKPIYRAYKPDTETDGITSWIKHCFDPFEVMTPDDGNVTQIVRKIK